MSESDEQPPTLNYASSDQAQARKYRNNAIVAAIFTCVGTVIAVPVVTFTTLASAWIGVPLGAGLALLVIFGGVRATRSPVHHGYGMGIWIGLGLAALIEGACFIVLSR